MSRFDGERHLYLSDRGRGRDGTHVRNADAWLFGIARNRALNALRRGRRLQAALTSLARRSVPSEADHGFDALELGEMTGRSAEAVRQRLARARAKLIAATTEED